MLRDQTSLSKDFVGLCGLKKDGAPKPKELVAPKPKSWFVRQKVLGANNHETEGLLSANIHETEGLLEYR